MRLLTKKNIQLKTSKLTGENKLLNLMFNTYYLSALKNDNLKNVKFQSTAKYVKDYISRKTKIPYSQDFIFAIACAYGYTDIVVDMFETGEVYTQEVYNECSCFNRMVIPIEFRSVFDFIINNKYGLDFSDRKLCILAIGVGIACKFDNHKLANFIIVKSGNIECHSILYLSSLAYYIASENGKVFKSAGCVMNVKKLYLLDTINPLSVLIKQMINDIFMNACKRGNVEIAENILENTDLDITELNVSDRKCNALVLACISGKTELVKVLLYLGASPTNNNCESIIKACECGHLSIVSLLMKDMRVQILISERKDNYGSSLSYGRIYDNNLILSFIKAALENNYEHIVMYILNNYKNGYKFDFWNYYLAKKSFEYGMIDLLKFLINTGDERGNGIGILNSYEYNFVINTLLLLAEKSNEKDIKNFIEIFSVNRYYISDNPSYFKFSFPILWIPIVSSKGYIDALNILIEKIPPLGGSYSNQSVYDDLKSKQNEIKNSTFNKSLAVAAQNGHYDIVKLLLFKGADKSAYDSYALKLAKENGHKKIIELLE